MIISYRINFVASYNDCVARQNLFCCKVCRIVMRTALILMYEGQTECIFSSVGLPDSVQYHKIPHTCITLIYRIWQYILAIQ